jgi:hypothetical protein
VRALRPLVFGALASFLLFHAFPASAWNASGHRVIALIAWDRLDPAAKREAAKILRAHPDFASWTKRARGQNLDEVAFIEASTWPDDIRRDKRFHSDRKSGDAKPDAPLPGFPDMARHADWHFKNIPFGKSRKGGKKTPPAAPTLPRYIRPGRLDERLRQMSEDLAPDKAPLAQRAFALPWVIHLAGEAHQPLHTAYRVDRPKLVVKNAFNPRKPTSTLHAFWDDLPAPSRLRGKALRDAVDALTATYPRSAFRNLSAPSDAWVEESWRIARARAYPPDADGETVTKAFFESSHDTARRRTVEAGYRLALLLNRQLAPRAD